MNHGASICWGNVSTGEIFDAETNQTLAAHGRAVFENSSRGIFY